MTQTISPLAPLSFPLAGSHLIEASAGTGKTYTIAMLYVRLVLGHGGSQAFTAGPLTPPQLLVVTFTDAATKELRDRIRARLTEAAGFFRADPATVTAPAKPDLLHDLRAQYDPQEWPTCARRLEVAAEWMDEAAVSTIHGWCNRMLREHAFDSQSLFNQKLETDQSDLLAEVVRDYWRIHYYPMSLDDITEVHRFWKTPDDLRQSALPLLSHVAQFATQDAMPADIMQATRDEITHALTQLKAPWESWCDGLQGWLDDAKSKKLFNGTKLKSNHYTDWIDTIRTWATTPAVALALSDSAWKRLCPDGIAEVWKGPVEVHPAIAALPALKQQLDALPDLEMALLAHAAHWIEKGFAAAQKQRSEIGFNELLTSLKAALEGPHGERLATTIRQQFPVALIDEFQDTDPIQYSIFERIYDITANRQDCALILIGDPKQAIYAFRGADIYTYLQARDAVGGRLYTLDTNFRSTQAMVDATNHCFAFSEEREDTAGAFLFRSRKGNPVPFLKVSANGRPDHFLVDGEVLPAMMIATMAQPDNTKADYLHTMAHACATQMVAWLSQGDSGQAGFGHGNTLQPVRPGDMAVLVNNRNEAAQIRRALAVRGVRSVYLSDRDSVYATAQATEIYRWLSACAEPDNDRLLRAALSTPTLGSTFAELDALNADEERWEEQVERFKHYRTIWQRQGVLPMLRHMLMDFACNERLLHPSYADGERILTDILHLAELLQQESFTLDGEHALIRFLSEQIADPSGDTDNKKLRLESDADLVKVITIHKSKGLEYPLVFLPFISAARAVTQEDVPLKFHDAQGKLQISLSGKSDDVAQADRERLGEDLRKLYVALTRARYLTWIGTGHLKVNGANALSYLMSGTSAETFAEGKPFMTVLASPEINDKPYVASTPEAVAGHACRPVRTARENWRFSSYSGLKVEGHATPESNVTEDTPQAENLLEARAEITPQVGIPRRPGGPMHRFPKGAQAGTFLHDLMEWVADAGFDKVLSDEAALREMIRQRCTVRGWEAWTEPLVQWIRQMMTTPLSIGATTLRLDSLTEIRAEMEFWFEASHVDLARMDQAVIAHTLGQRERPHLTPDRLNGILKGFIDLIIQHDGRYYVIDYKSNWLGAGDEDYTTDNMDEAIRAHRYDLQYVIYLLALHRLLRSRMPGYDYDTHIGGAAYLFIRGIGAATGGVHFERPPKALIMMLDALFAGQQGEAA